MPTLIAGAIAILRGNISNVLKEENMSQKSLLQSRTLDHINRLYQLDFTKEWLQYSILDVVP